MRASYRPATSANLTETIIGWSMSLTHYDTFEKIRKYLDHLRGLKLCRCGHWEQWRRNEVDGYLLAQKRRETKYAVALFK